MFSKLFPLSFWVLSLHIFFLPHSQGQSPTFLQEVAEQVAQVQPDEGRTAGFISDVFAYAKVLHWQEELCADDIQLMNRIIALSNGRGSEFEPNMMIPALVHRCNQIAKEKTPATYAPYLLLLQQTKDLSDAQFDRYLLDQIQKENLRKFHSNTRHYYAIDDALLEVCLLRQCRYLRQGRAPTVELHKELLTETQWIQLEQSACTATDAIQYLLKELAQVDSVSTQREYGYLQILGSYGPTATHQVLRLLQHPAAYAAYSPMGQKLLWTYLLRQTKVDLLKSQQLELIALLSDHPQYTAQRHLLCHFRHQIQGIDLVDCWASK